MSLPSPFTIFSPQLLAFTNGDFWNFNQSKFSYPQLSHRSTHYVQVNQQSMKAMGKYQDIPQNYHVLYLPSECAHPSLPFNLDSLTKQHSIYVVNDSSSEHAYREALKINPQAIKVTDLSARQEVAKQFEDKPVYFYTFYSKLALQKGEISPEPVPLEGQILVCSLDYCAHYLSVDISKHGIVLFQSGRGFGLSGMSILIVRKDLFGKQLGTCPDMLCYERTLTANSVINTPYTLVPLLILKQLQLALSQGYDLKKIRDQLTLIKVQYQQALRQHTEVAQTVAQGIVKFKFSVNIVPEQLEQYGWVDGEWLIIILQLSNKQGSAAFVSHLFK